MTPAQIAELQRWARRVATEDADEPLQRATRAVVRLAGEALRRRDPDGGGGWDWAGAGPAGTPPPTLEQLERIRRFAKEAADNGGSDELRAAARAILLLCDDLDALEGEDVATPEPVPARVRARDRVRARPALDLTRTFGRWRRASPLAALSLLLPLASFAGLIAVARAAAPDLDPRGPAGGLVNAAELKQLAFSIAGDAGTLERAEWKLDGKEVTGRAKLARDRVTFRPGKLGEGAHRIEVSLPGLALWSQGATAWSFTVDTVAPEIRVTKGSLRAQARSPYSLRGAIGDGASLTIGGKEAELEDGRFTVAYDAPPTKAIRFVASDAAGNTSTSTLTVKLVPRRPPNPIRGVHVSADAWASDQLRGEILSLIEQGKINAVQLDLKDESGVIGWDAAVPLARKAGAVRDTFDLEAAVEQLHAKGVRVIGRLVAFRDPILSEWAWKQKKRGMVVQTPGGGPYSGGYGGFTNFADEDVRAYNVAVAVAAAKLGVDDILYDYVRRPDGPLDTMVFPGLSGSATDSITGFMRESRVALAPTGAFLGVSVFGIAATRPEEIAQDIPSIAREVDYVAPMVYPSHWGPYEYELENPSVQPYEIVNRSLADFQEAVSGTGARVIPWLQDFSLGVDYGPAEVRAQIDGAADAGMDDFLLWDPAVTYTAGALADDAPLPTIGVAKPGKASEELVKLPSTSGSAQAEPAKQAAPAAEEEGPVDSGLEPNELGMVPVLMYHQVVPDGGSEYDLTPAEFRAELERLYEEHYRPITAADLVNGTIDVPKGTTPVVLTFDDSTASQAVLRDDGTIDPDTAVGIMLEFAESHPGFRPAATFYLNGGPFAAGEKTGELLRWLVANGFELGNHTRDHVNFSEVSDTEVQRQLVLQSRIIREQVPDLKIVTMALPFGVMPDPPRLARKGSWDGESYAFKGVMLVGAEPAPSPFSSAFDGAGIPRIRSAPETSVELASAYWLDTLAASPELRFVSDGDPDAITFPEDRQDALADRFADRAKPY